MFLHYFKNKENKDKSLANDIYINIVLFSKKISNKHFINQTKNFDLMFEITSVLIFCIFFESSKNKDIIKKIVRVRQEIMNLYISDLDYSLRLSGVGDMNIGKYVKTYVKKFYFRISELEEIFQNNSIIKFESYLKVYRILDKKYLVNDVESLFNQLIYLKNISKNYKKPNFVYQNLFN